QDEAKGAAFAVVRAAHVGTQERSGRAGLLRIPWGAVRADVALAQAGFHAQLQVFPQGGILGLDLFFGQVAGKQESSLAEQWLALGVGFDDITREEPWAGQDRGQEFGRKAMLSNLFGG